MTESVRSRRTTLTEAIVQELQRAVQSGLFPHGCQLPSLAELTGFPVDPRETVRKSLRRIEERQIIVRRCAAGAFVRNSH